MSRGSKLTRSFLREICYLHGERPMRKATRHLLVQIAGDILGRPAMSMDCTMAELVDCAVARGCRIPKSMRKGVS
jgi:hypothetical protein